MFRIRKCGVKRKVHRAGKRLPISNNTLENFCLGAKPIKHKCRYLTDSERTKQSWARNEPAVPKKIASKFSFGHPECPGQFRNSTAYNCPTVRMLQGRKFGIHMGLR
ncbi:hypothetical protein OkiPb01551_29780 [Bordetella pertussis]|nr:hypothetical protein BPJ_03950 [Bordetella pertussis]BDT06691.1 hypothetical protein BP3J_03950 [Bordetella pertussis]